MKSEEIISIIISVFFGIFLFLFSNLFIANIFKNLILQIILNVLAISIPLVNFFLIFSYKEKIKKEKEFYFSTFLRDFVENIKSGKSIVSTLETLKENDYRSLSPLVEKLYLEVKLGIPFDKALNNLAKRSESKLIKRMSLTIGEALKAGGDAASIIESIIKSFIEIEKIRREREMISVPTKVNGFMIYFMFLLIIIILLRFLIPSIQRSQNIKIEISEIKQILVHLILIQSFFSGLLIGKMSEGSVTLGLRYSIFLMLIGYIIFSFLA